MRKLTPEQTVATDAAYERGWVDSLDGLWGPTNIPTDQLYWYRVGWDACAEYRWQDRNGRGVAPDRTYRTPRTEDM